jgi:hypothetical protein
MHCAIQITPSANGLIAGGCDQDDWARRSAGPLRCGSFRPPPGFTCLSTFWRPGLFALFQAREVLRSVLAFPRARTQRSTSPFAIIGSVCWPQRDLNPCYRLERSGRGVSSTLEQCRIVMTSWANIFEPLRSALSIGGSGAAQTRPETRVVNCPQASPSSRVITDVLRGCIQQGSIDTR